MRSLRNLDLNGSIQPNEAAKCNYKDIIFCQEKRPGGFVLLRELSLISYHDRVIDRGRFCAIEPAEAMIPHRHNQTHFYRACQKS